MRLRLILNIARLAVAASIPAAAAPSLIGRWWTEDRSGVIEIYPCGTTALCGRIVGEDKPHNDDGSISMAGTGVPYCRLTIIHDAVPIEPGRWRGRILNPDDGSEWRSELWVGDDGALRLRGYVVLPLLGQTQVWPPFRGTVRPDCSIVG